MARSSYYRLERKEFGLHAGRFNALDSVCAAPKVHNFSASVAFPAANLCVPQFLRCLLLSVSVYFFFVCATHWRCSRSGGHNAPDCGGKGVSKKVVHMCGWWKTSPGNLAMIYWLLLRPLSTRWCGTENGLWNIIRITNHIIRAICKLLWNRFRIWTYSKGIIPTMFHKKECFISVHFQIMASFLSIPKNNSTVQLVNCFDLAVLWLHSSVSWDEYLFI